MLFRSITAVLACLWLTLVCHAAAPQTPAGGLTITPSTIELGRQIQKQTIEREVTLLNATNVPLEILKVIADCDCTTPVPKETRLASGASTILFVRFETRNYTGEVHRRIQLTTTAGVQVLTLKVNVAPYKDWEIAPLPLILPTSLTDQSVSLDASVRFLGTTSNTFVTSASTNSPWLEARLDASPGLDAQGAQTLVLTKRPEAASGTHTVFLELTTTGGDALVLNVPVIVPIVSRLRISPNPIILPPVKPGVETSATFRILGWRDAKPPRVVTSRGILASLGEKDGEHTFQLTWKPETTGNLVWSVQIFREEIPEVEVSVLHQATAN